MKRLLALSFVVFFCSISQGGIEYAHQDSSVSACPDGSQPTVTGVFIDMNIYCYGDYSDMIMLSVDNRKLSNDPLDGVHVMTDYPKKCGDIVRYVDLRDMAGKIDLHQVVHARVIAMANTYPAKIKQIGFTHDCP